MNVEPTPPFAGERITSRQAKPPGAFRILTLMQMPAMPMSITDWSEVETTCHPGDTGNAIWRTRTFGDIRVRMVEYSPGYSADHWCSKGHVILCLKGGIAIELGDGTHLALRGGQSYHVGDGNPPHRSTTGMGALLFIVD